jgi:2-polyprenyl-3-methyl-5-hydroxy-6-metoxy-1,4-benzoquinol methylase
LKEFIDTSSNDYRRIAGLLERVLLLLEILEILGRDERLREIMHLPVPYYVIRELRQAVHEEVRESLNMISSKIDKLTLNFTTTHQLVNEIVLKGMCPYCQKDLMAYIKNDELLLMCRNQGTDMCKTYAWAITKVRQVSL